jgi:hypothetical protein
MPGTRATVQQPRLNGRDRAEQLALLAARLRSPDGLDREVLARIERLSDEEQQSPPSPRA